MENTIIIEVEMINTCAGLGAKFWNGKKVESQTDLRHVLDEMNRLTAYYNNSCGKAVLFATR